MFQAPAATGEATQNGEKKGNKLRRREIVPTRVQMYSKMYDHTVHDLHVLALPTVPVIRRMLYMNS